jgi:hypothetical protein
MIVASFGRRGLRPHVRNSPSSAAPSPLRRQHRSEGRFRQAGSGPSEPTRFRSPDARRGLCLVARMPRGSVADLSADRSSLGMRRAGTPGPLSAGPMCHAPRWGVPSEGCVGPWPRSAGPVCHAPHSPAHIGWGTCALSPVLRGRCAISPERPGLPHRECGPQAPAPEPGCPCARAAGAAPAPGRVLVIVDRYCPPAGSNDPRSCLTGLVPCWRSPRGAGLVPTATLVTGITRSAWLRWSGGGQSWHAP